MYVAVTGATGKIGRWIVRELIERGHRVRAMVRPTRDGHWGNTAPAVEEMKRCGADIFQADFSENDSLKRFVTGVEVIVHNGYHHINEEEHPAEWTRLNILSSVIMYEAAWKAGVQQIIFISSGAAYGRGPVYERERFGVTLPIDERTMTAPRGMYAAYKSCIENATVAFKTVHGMKPSTSIRPLGDGIGELMGFRIYDDVGAFSDVVKKLLSGEKVTLKLPPRLICVDGRDIGIGCDLLIKKGCVEKAEIGDWYLVGNAPITPGQFVETIKEVFGPVPLEVEEITNDFPCSDAQIVKLGYQPRGSQVTLREHFVELASRLGHRK
jgi:nucleoside-diphosphate-sugar epimerase